MIKLSQIFFILLCFSVCKLGAQTIPNDITGPLIVCANSAEKYEATFDENNTTCDYLYNWVITGGKFTANNSESLSGTGYKTVYVKWTAGANDHEISYSANNALEDGGGGGLGGGEAQFCTEEDLYTYSGTLSPVINGDAEALPELSTWTFPDEEDNSIVCSETGVVSIEEDNNSGYEIETTLYYFDENDEKQIVKDWSAPSSNTIPFTLDYENFYKRITFYSKSRFKYCNTIQNDNNGGLVKDFYLNPNMEVIGEITQPSCKGESASFKIKFTEGEIGSVFINVSDVTGKTADQTFEILPSGTENEFLINDEVDGEIYDVNEEKMVPSKLKLTGGEYVMSIEPNLDLIDDFPCGSDMGPIIVNEPHIASFTNIENTPSDTLDIYCILGGSVSFEVSSNKSESTYYMLEKDGNNYYPSNQTIPHENTKTINGLSEGSYTLFIKANVNCGWDDSTKFRFNYKRPTEITEQPTTSTKVLECVGDNTGEISITATTSISDDLVNFSYSRNSGEWIPLNTDGDDLLETNTATFKNLPAGTYVVRMKSSSCSGIDSNYTNSEEVVIENPNPITIGTPTLTPPTCLGGDDGAFEYSFARIDRNGSFDIQEAEVQNKNGDRLERYVDYEISGLFINQLSAGDKVVSLTVLETNDELENCTKLFNRSDVMQNPAPGTYFDFNSQIKTDPICYDDLGTFVFSYSNANGTVTKYLVNANDPCIGDESCGFGDDISGDVSEISFTKAQDSISFDGAARNNSYVVVLIDGNNCDMYSDIITFNVPNQAQMTDPEVNAAAGGIKSGDDYYVQCKDDQIEITWPLNFDSNSGNVSDDFTITKDGETLERDNDYTVYSDKIVLHNANVINSTSTTYEITGTDGDGCTLSTADDSNLFILKQVEDEFKIDHTETKVKVWYKDKEDNDYHLKHAKDTNGTVFMKAMGGMLLDGGSQNYHYSLYDADEDTLITESVEKGANDIYVFDSLLQAQKNYRFEIVDRLGCLKDSTFRLNAPDTLEIETTLNTSYAGGVNIACKNGTDTVKVQTSGGLYPHFVELKSGETTYFSQTIYSSEYTAIFSNVAAGNYYVQVTDKYDSHYPTDFQYSAQTENFDLIEPTDSVDFEYEMQEPTCYYSLDGELTITPSGGIPFPNDEYIIMFYNQEGTTLLDSIKGTSATFIDSAGFYKVEVYDANSFNYNTVCTVKNSVLEIENIPQLITDTLYSDHPLCLGDSTGKINVRAIGGRSENVYSFELYDSTKSLIDSLILADTNQHTFENLFSGQYTVKIYDTVSCQFSRDIYLKERTDTLKIVNLQPLESTCSNTIDAAIDVTTTGGDGRHSLSIDQGQSWIQLDSGDYNYQFTDLAGGQLYEIWLKDENYYEDSYQSSCLIIDTVSIARTDSVMLSAEVEQVSCFGESDGSIKIKPSYGKDTNSENFSFEWYKNGELLENETAYKLENLSRGSYNVKVTYGTIDCSQKSLEIGISQPSKPFAIDSITAQAYNCETSDPLKVQVNLSGGWISQKYKVQIDNLISDSVQIDEYNTLSVYENLEYGDHQITVWDAKGCEVSDSFSIDYQRPVIDVIEVSNVKCNGEATGTIKVSGQYEIMDYYLWNDSIDFDLESQHQDSVLFNGLAAGQYNLWNKKGNCSSDTIIITITEPTKLQLNPYIVSEATCGQNNGELDVNIEGGTPPYLTTWLNSIDPSAVGAGDYRVTVEDSLGCSFTSEISMIEVSPIEIVIDSLKDSYCNLNNGFAEVSINGASPPFTINWNGVESGNSKSGLSPGQYEIEVVDALECTQSISFEIKEPLPVKANVVEYREADCDIANGFIRFEYKNLKSPYDIIWPESVNPLDDFSANGLAAGEMYSLQIIDSAGCSHEFSFNIPDKSDLSIDFEVKRPSCENENGLIKAEVTGGSGDYNYKWSTGEENIDSISNLTAGFYYLTVEDALGCKVTDSVSLVDDPNVFPEYDIIKTEPSCLENDGVIEIQFLEQDHNFEIYWPNYSMVSNRMESLTAGNYSLQLRNEEGCSKELSIELVPFQKPSLEVESIKMPGCGNANGEIMITESSQLNYVWSNSIIGDTYHAENLEAGNYWVYGETEDQCKTDTLFFTLDNIDSDLIIQTQSIISNSCPNSNDGSIEINVIGGLPPYTYLWNDDEQQTQAEAIDLDAGSYTVLVKDANECSTSKSFNLQSENPVFIASFEQIEPQCFDSFDGSLTVNVGGGKGNYTYEWSNGDTTQTADSLAIGNYNVKVYDGTDCFAYEEVSLPGPAPIDIQLETGAPICRGEDTGYANLNISGGSGEYDVLWEDGNKLDSRSDLLAGSQIVTIQDNNGCEREFEIIIPERADINVQYTVIEPSCFGASDGRIEINNVFNANNPFVEWQDGARGFLRQNLASGLYVYSITDNSNCAIQDTITLGDPDPLEIINLDLQNPLCYGQSNGAISFDVQGGSGNYQYFWKDGFINKNRSSLKDGSYELTVQDDNGCSLTKEFILNQPDTIVIDYVVSPVSCFGNADGAIELNISGGVGGYTIDWNDNEKGANRESLATGTYFVSVIDSNGCERTQRIVVPEPSPLDISVNRQQPSCNGGTDGQLTVEVSGGNKPYEIKWEDGSTANTIDSLASGSYFIEILDAKGCEFSTSITLNQPSVVRVSEEITENPICYQEPTGYAEIIPTGGVENYGIEWHDGDTLFQRNDLMAGVHTYTIYDDNGCTYEDQITLEDPDEINIEGLPEEVYLCGSGSLILDGGDKWTGFNWTSNNGFSEETQEVEINQEGTYTLNTVNADGCTDDYTFEVYKDDNLIDTDFLLTSDAIVGDTVIIVDVSWPAPDSVIWHNQDNPDIYVVSQNEVYQEVIFTKAGDFELGMRAHISLCQDDIRKTVKVMSPEVAEMQRNLQEQLGTNMNLEVNVYPNPNYGKFRVKSEMNQIQDIEIHIFDLNKGRVITSISGKESKNYVFDIDDQNLPAGVYLVMAESGGKTTTKKFIVK